MQGPGVSALAWNQTLTPTAATDLAVEIEGLRRQGRSGFGCFNVLFLFFGVGEMSLCVL